MILGQTERPQESGSPFRFSPKAWYGDNHVFQFLRGRAGQAQPPRTLTTLSGSFDLRDVAASSVSTLVNALPTPALLVDEAYSIVLCQRVFRQTR